jgi:hypothetical protein
MRYFKIYILIFAIITWTFPIKIFGYFATPDKYIHSMPFGTKNNNAGINKSVVIPDLSQYPPSPLISPDSLNPDQNNKTVPVGSPNVLPKNSFPFWIIFALVLVFIFVFCLIFYKFKKYRKVI